VHLFLILYKEENSKTPCPHLLLARKEGVTLAVRKAIRTAVPQCDPALTFLLPTYCCQKLLLRIWVDKRIAHRLHISVHPARSYSRGADRGYHAPPLGLNRMHILLYSRG